MDRRQQKTRAAIIASFDKLLSTKNYNKITIQEIIDEANIGRSTFYAHFETKDMVLISICTEMFDHIFLEELPEQINTDTDQDTMRYLEFQLSHILFHLKQNNIDVHKILRSEGQQIFLSHFRKYIDRIFTNYLKGNNQQIPTDFLLNFLTDSFMSTASWWILSKSDYTDNEIANYYITVVEKNLPGYVR